MKLNYLKQNWALWLALILSLVIRLHQLDFQSLWLDEIYTMNMGDPKNSFSDIYGLSQYKDPQSVLYFIMLNVIFKVVAFTPYVARFVSVLFGVLGIWFIYKLGKEIRNKSTGIIAAFLLTVNYFHIFYSQEARVYAMFTAFTCLSFYHLVKFLKNPKASTAVFYGLTTLLMALSHFFSLFVLVSQAIIILAALVFKQADFMRVIKYSLISVFIVVVGFIPIIPILLFLSKATSSWIPEVTTDAFKDLYNGFFGGSFLLILFSVFLIIFYLFQILNEENISQKDDDHKQKLIPVFCFLFIWTLVGFFIPYCMSFTRYPTLVDRYLIYILPPIILMIALGFDTIKNVKLKNALVILFLGISLFEIVYVKKYYKTEVKSNFRDATKFLVGYNNSNSKIITSLPYHFDYYLKKYNSKVLAEEMVIDTLVEKIRSGKTEPEPFWLINSHKLGYIISDTNAMYLEKNFEQVLNYRGFDAWAKYFVPKKSTDTLNPVLRINSKNFFAKQPYPGDNDIYIYNNDTLSSPDFSLDEGNYKVVVKSRSIPAIPIKGVNAHLSIFLNAVESASYFVTDRSFMYGDTIKFFMKEKGLFNIKFGYDNDAWTDNEDRNVIIRDVSIYKY